MKNIKLMRLFALWGGACLLLALCLVQTPAQSGTSSVRGTVTDQQGGAVPGATVKISNEAKNFSRTQTTDGDGNYLFTALPPDSYRLEAEMTGFKKAVVNDVRALVDSPANVPVQLAAGNISEVVTVSSNSVESLINTQDASIGTAFVPQQITDLPTFSRNVQELLNLQPGVTRDGTVAGVRSDQSNVTFDGIDVNDQQEGTAFNSVLRLTAESVQEFRITTANANASQGRSSGAQVSLISRSGSNDFHGALFEFHLPTIGQANDFFNNRAGIARPVVLRNVFGGALGGPIVKDKAFFFYSFEGFRERKSSTVVRTVPLASLGRGELRFMGAAPGDPTGTNRVVTVNTTQFTGIFPAVGINPAALALLADAARRYPANDTTVGDGLNTGGYRFNAPLPDDRNTHILRFDFNLTDRQVLFARGNYQYDNRSETKRFPDTFAPQTWTHPYGGVIGHTWTISGTKVNNFRYGLTRQAFTQGGDDSSRNSVNFRFVFQPLNYSRTLSRVTPTQNITDDFSWTLGNHSVQFGGNVRIIRNRRVDFGKSFDDAVVNPSFYDQSGRVLDRPVTAAGYTIGVGQRSSVQNAAASLIGRYSQYNGNFNYNLDGSVQAIGTPLKREFATEEMEVYAQDSWKIRSNLTLGYGLRYSLSRPVYETQGFQVKPNRSLGDFFDQRVARAAQGRPLNDSLQFELAGPANDKPGFYELDKNNFQPRVSLVWSPNFSTGFLSKLFGKNGASVLRGGFAMTNDFFGEQLAVSFDQLSTLGFSTSNTISANTYNVSTRPGPLFTGLSQTIRGLPGITAPNRFNTPADEAQRIESSLDDTLISPTTYSWNASYGRQLPAGFYVEAAYVGRAGRNLLATRDIMALNNLVDPRSGTDWYTAAGMLHDLRERNVPLDQIRPIAYFENLFPGLGASFWGRSNLSATQSVYQIVARQDYLGDDFFNVLDWTYVQLLLDDESTVVGRNAFFHPQYAAFSAFSTVAESDYHGGLLTVRQRYRNSFSLDLNYTFSKSLDNASGLQTSGSYGSAFILNPLRPRDNYAVSDFDIRHILNANFLLQLPFGKGRKFFGNANGVVDALLGGWQMTGIYRFNSGQTAPTPFDAAQWATNWNVQSNGVRIRDIRATENRRTANLFADPVAAYRSFRNARPGETGDRNILRLPSYSSLDLGLSKSFKMPWSETHKLQIRFEVFNVANTQKLDIQNVTRQTFGLDIDSPTGDPTSVFGNFDSIQGAPRRIQLGLRYSF